VKRRKNEICNKGRTEFIRFPTDKIFDTEKEAVDFIDNYCRGRYYAGCAVKFYDYTNVKPAAKIIELRNKISENNKKNRVYQRKLGKKPKSRIHRLSVVRF